MRIIDPNPNRRQRILPSELVLLSSILLYESAPKLLDLLCNRCHVRTARRHQMLIDSGAVVRKIVCVRETAVVRRCQIRHPVFAAGEIVPRP